MRKVPSHGVAVLMLGAVSQVGQVILLREFLVVFHGNELSIGLILAAWLVWVGVGSHLGALLAERVERPRLLLVLGSVGLVWVLPITVVLVRRLRGFFDIFPGAYLSLADMALSCFLLAAPACLLLGAQFVLLSRVWRERDRAEDSSGAEKTYIGEAAGTVLGGLLYTFVMVHTLGSLQSVVLAAALMLMAVFLVARGRNRRGRASFPSALVLVGILTVALWSFPALERAEDWAYRVQWESFSPQHQLVQTHHSKHGIISVAQREDQYSFFQSGHLVFTAAGPETAVPGMEEQEAVNFAHLAMVQHRSPGRILLIGGGLRGVLNEILEHPVKRVDYVELDEVLTEAARPYVSLRTQEALTDPRVRLIHADGRLFVKTTRQAYDMIIVDHPDPFTAEANRYYTQEFFREAQDLLRPDGVFVTSVGSTPNLRGTAIANRNTTLYHTVNSLFSHVLVAGDRSMFFFASDAPEQISVDAAVLSGRYVDRGVASAVFSPARYHTLLEETQLQRVNWVVRHHGRTAGAHLQGPGALPPFPGTPGEQAEGEADLPAVEERYFINSDVRPIGYFYTLVFWEDLTRDDPVFSLQHLLRVKPGWILPIAFIPLLLALGLRWARKGDGRRRAADFAILFTVFTTGLSTMSLQVALLLSFQSIYGFVYEMVGLITAIFMGGLALGAYGSHRYVADKTNLRTLAIVQAFMALLAVVIAVTLPPAAALSSPPAVFLLFSVLTFGAGLANGIDFPLAVACYLALHRRVERSTGTVYGVELFGACVGAIGASVAVAPIHGIVACCLLAGIASGTACVVILISGGDWRHARQRNDEGHHEQANVS